MLGVGSYVPDAIVDNEHIKQRLGVDPEMVVRQTGIRERRYALPHQATSDLCYEAARRCLDRTGVNAGDVDMLIVGTVTSDMSFPSTACLVQDRLGLCCPAFDLQAACAGFLYAIVTGSCHVLAGASKMAMVIGGDCMSRVVNPNDYKTCTLLGDGAGAVLLTRGRPEQGLLSYTLGSEGSGAPLLTRPACGSRLPPTPEALAADLHYLHMDGRAVFRWAVSTLCDTIQDVLKASGLRPDEVDLYIPHQANLRIIHAAADALQIPRDRFFTNIDRFGNTSSASVPLALDEALAEGRVKSGSRLLMSGFGAGLVWGTAIWTW
jgi:3-oxoacyl-[acyl-carrier-protein] synthase-3